MEYFSINNIEKKNNKLEIFLLELEDLYDRSHMFDGCDCLEEVSFFYGYKEESKEIVKERKYFF